MGHYADKFAGKTSEEQQKFFLNTGDSNSFARKLYFDFSSQEKKVSLVSITNEGLVSNLKYLWAHFGHFRERTHPPKLSHLRLNRGF